STAGVGPGGGWPAGHVAGDRPAGAVRPPPPPPASGAAAARAAPAASGAPGTPPAPRAGGGHRAATSDGPRCVPGDRRPRWGPGRLAMAEATGTPTPPVAPRHAGR